MYMYLYIYACMFCIFCREKENHESRLRELEEEMEGQVLKLEQQVSEQVRAKH